MNNKEKVKRYVEAMGYLTRAEGYITYEKPHKEGEVAVEILEPVKRPLLPHFMGTKIDVYA